MGVREGEARNIDKAILLFKAGDRMRPEVGGVL